MIRSNLTTLVKLLLNIPNGKFTEMQENAIKKTPFAELLLGIVEAKLNLGYVMKSDRDALALIRQYEGLGARFKLGSKSVKLTAKEIALIFGIQSGATKIELQQYPRVPDSPFALRLFPKKHDGPKILYVHVLAHFFEKAVKGEKVEDARDVARVLSLILIGTLFLPNSQARVSWAYLDYIDDLERSTSYAWSTFITKKTIEALNKRFSTPETNYGCVLGLMVNVFPCHITLFAYEYKKI